MPTRKKNGPDTAKEPAAPPPRRWHKPIDEVKRLAGPLGEKLTDDELYRLDQAMYGIAKAYVQSLKKHGAPA